jgi:flagellar operon protein (TIGR03826 family)
MEVRNCKSCKRLFNYLSGPRLCPACTEELEKKFTLVKDYIWDHPNANMATISDEFDVSSQQIKQWIREEKLILTDASPVFLDCENCGKPIKSGRYCDSCKSNLQNTLSSALNKPVEKADSGKQSRDGDRMRFLDK